MKCNGKIVNLGADYYRYLEAGVAGPTALKFFQHDMCAEVRLQGRCDPALCEAILAEVRQVPFRSIPYLRGTIRSATYAALRAADREEEEEPCPEIYQNLFRLP